MFSGNPSSYRSVLVSFGFSLSIHLLIALALCILSLDTKPTFLKLFAPSAAPSLPDSDTFDAPPVDTHTITLKKLDNVLPEELRELFKESNIVPSIMKKLAPQPAVQASVKVTKVVKPPKQRKIKPKPEIKPPTKKGAKKVLTAQPAPQPTPPAEKDTHKELLAKNETKTRNSSKKSDVKQAPTKNKQQESAKQSVQGASQSSSPAHASSMAIIDHKSSGTAPKKTATLASSTDKVSIEFIDDLTPEDQSSEADEATTQEIYDIITTSWEPLAGWEDAGPVTIKVVPKRFGGSYSQPEFVKKSLAVAKNQLALTTVTALINSGKVKGRTFNLTFK